MEFLNNGVRTVIASRPQDGQPEDCVAVIASGGRQPWVLRFYARLGTHRAYLGAVRLFALQTERVVAYLSAPGAQGFETEGESLVTTADRLGIEFVGTVVRGGPWGVQSVLGASVNAARSYRCVTGVAGAVTVTGEVYGWAAQTSQAGASVAVAAQPALGFGPLIVPQNGTIAGDARGLLAPVSTWTFVNTDSYFIEFVPPGGVFDG